MIYINNKGNIHVDCTCGCGSGFTMEVGEWEDACMYLRTYTGSGRLIYKINALKEILLGKDYCFTDTLMSYEEWKEFVKCINLLDKKVEENR